MSHLTPEHVRGVWSATPTPFTAAMAVDRVAVQRLVEDRVEIYFLPPEHGESLKGGLAQYVSVHIPAVEAWDEARRTAWEAAAHDKMDVEGES